MIHIQSTQGYQKAWIIDGDKVNLEPLQIGKYNITVYKNGDNILQLFEYFLSSINYNYQPPIPKETKFQKFLKWFKI
jgi:hypothetical protein